MEIECLDKNVINEDINDDLHIAETPRNIKEFENKQVKIKDKESEIKEILKNHSDSIEMITTQFDVKQDEALLL